MKQSIISLSLILMVYLLLHVPISLLLSLPSGSRGAQDEHLIQLEELLTQAVLQVLVQLAAGTQYVRHVRSRNKSQGKLFNLDQKGHRPNEND